MKARLALACLAAGLLLAGCAAPALQTADRLILTARRGPAAFELLSVRFDGPPALRAIVTVAGCSAAPAPVALARDGSVVALASGTPSRLLWAGGGVTSELTLTGVAAVLDAAAGRLVLALNDHPAASAPGMAVDRGVILRLPDESFAALAAYDIDARAPLGAPLAARPLARLGPLRQLVLAPDPAASVDAPAALAACDFSGGSPMLLDHTAPLPTTHRIAAAEPLPGGRFVVLAAQVRGRRWNLFDLLLWDAQSGGLAPLLPDPIYSAIAPGSLLAPTLPLLAINERHVAFTASRVTAWRDELPVDGDYATLIVDVTTRAALCRISHPGRGLQDAVPPPYLPADRLSALRIPYAPGPAISGAPQRWNEFLTLASGRLTTADGRAFWPDELSAYAYTPAPDHALPGHRRPAADAHEPGSGPAALAVRFRPRGASGDADVCIVLTHGGCAAEFPVAHLETLTWLSAR